MSRVWTPRQTRNGLEYGGSAHIYYWDPSRNPGASYENCMANCTTYAYGRILEAGDPAPISGWYSAAAWHGNLINGWTYEAFDVNNCRVGDLVEWYTSDRNHVAVIEYITATTIYVSQSYYTGDHGQSYWQGDFDTRTAAVMGSTMQSVSNWMIANYPNRFFAYGAVTDAYNAMPDLILRNPNSIPTVDDTFKFFGRNKKTQRRRIIHV